MAFSTKLSENFGRVVESSSFVALDPVVKCNYIQKGRNLIFGRGPAGDGDAELLYLGKVMETATGTSYLGADAWLDAKFPHVIYITGTRGSGKSVDLGIIIEGLAALKVPSPVQNNVSPVATILIDTQSHFWTLRHEPTGDVASEQLADLGQWSLRANSLADAVVYIPPGSKPFLGDERLIQIRPRDVLHEEWCALLGQDVYSPQGHLLAEVLEKLGETNFSIEDMLRLLREGRLAQTVAEASRNVLIYRLTDYLRTQLFDPSGLMIDELLVPGRCNIFMLRDLRDEDKSIVTAILARQLFIVMGKHHHEKRVANFFGKAVEGSTFPNKVWLLIDEAHVICPNSGPSPARDALVEYTKRGRDAGLSLVMATQQPSAVDDRVLSQVNITLSHRLSFQNDIASAVARIPTRTLDSVRIGGAKVNDFADILRMLEAGQCFIGDHSTSRTIMLQMRPRITAHGGQSPV